MSRPARLDYPRALEATPSMREMRARRIDPSTAQGRILYARAETELCHAAREMREEERYCSVWKRIRHRDGREIPDRTEEVEALLSGAAGSTDG